MLLYTIYYIILRNTKSIWFFFYCLNYQHNILYCMFSVEEIAKKNNKKLDNK